MTTPSLATEAALAGDYPSRRFNQRERKLLASVKTYVDSLSPDTVITTEGDIIVGDSDGDAARLAKGSNGLPLVAGASTVSYAALSATGLASDSVTTAKILNANVTLAKLASGITPSHVVKFAGTFTTAGGDAAESISVPGALGTDIVAVTVKTAGASPASVVAAAAGTDAIAVTMSADPDTDHVLQYVVYRAAS
jgi:hypothetical protein